MAENESGKQDGAAKPRRRRRKRGDGPAREATPRILMTGARVKGSDLPAELREALRVGSGAVTLWVESNACEGRAVDAVVAAAVDEAGQQLPGLYKAVPRRGWRTTPEVELAPPIQVPLDVKVIE